MDIIDLKMAPQYLPTLVNWHHQQWSYLNPHANLNKRHEEMQAYLEQGFVPSTLVAIDQQQLLGSAAIIANDMDTHLNLSPWLASVYVDHDFRRQGVGSALVLKVMALARQFGIDSLYLFTPDQQRFYQRLGWSGLSQELYRGHQVTIMKCDLIEF